MYTWQKHLLAICIKRRAIERKKEGSWTISKIHWIELESICAAAGKFGR